MILLQHLNLTVNNTLTSTTDVTICSNQLPYSWNSQTYNAAGTLQCNVDMQLQDVIRLQH
ncbi:MAG: hypothetical protein V9E88_01545 [Ferruginibacter sp.]